MSQFLNIQPRRDQPDGYYKVGISRSELHKMLARSMEALRGYAGGAAFAARTKTTKKIKVEDIVEQNLNDFERQIKELLGPDRDAESVIFDADMEEICDGISHTIQSIQEDILRGCQAALHMPHKMLGAEMNRLKGGAQEELKGRHFLIKTDVEPGTNILAEFCQYPSLSVAFVQDTMENISLPYIYELIQELKEKSIVGENEELSLENFEKIMRCFGKFTDSINAFLHKTAELAISGRDCSYEMLHANLVHELKKFTLFAEKIQDDDLGEIFMDFAGKIHNRIAGMTKEEFETMSLDPPQDEEIERYVKSFKKARLTECEHSAMIFIPGKIGLDTNEVPMTDKERDFLELEIKRMASANSLTGINDWDKKFIKELTENVNNEFYAGYRLRKIVDIKVFLGAFYGELEIDINFDDDESPSSKKRRTNGAKKSPVFEMPFPESILNAENGSAEEAPQKGQAAPEAESEKVTDSVRMPPASTSTPEPAIPAEPATPPASEAAPAAKTQSVPRVTPPAAPSTAHTERSVPAPKNDDEPLTIDTENFGSLENKLCALKELYAKLTAAPLEGEKEIKKSRMILRIVETAMEVCEDPRFAEITSDSRKERIVYFALKICAQSMTKKGNFILNGIDLSLLIQDIWELSHAGVNDRELIPVLGGIKSILDKMDAKIAELQRKLRENEGQGATIETLKSTLDEKTEAIELNKQTILETQQLLANQKEERDRLQEEALGRGELPDEKTEQKIAREIRELMTKLITMARAKEQLEKDAINLQEALVAVHEKHSPDPEILEQLEQIMRDREDLLSQLNSLADKHTHA